MSFYGDPHDPRFELELADSIVLSALGDPVDEEFREHWATCPQCQAELAALTHMAQVARECTEHRADLDAVPAASVWTGIAAELNIDTASMHRSVPESSRRARLAHWRTKVVAAAAAGVLVVAGLGIGFLVGRDTTQTRPSALSTARLAHMPGGPVGASGSATIRSTPHGDELSITTDGLPLRDGYYEVWLFNPTINQMVAIGTLADNGAGTFPIPAGLDPHAYHIADVSAQKYNGNAAHQQSVLRGPLAR